MANVSSLDSFDEFDDLCEGLVVRPMPSDLRCCGKVSRGFAPAHDLVESMAKSTTRKLTVA